MRTVGREQLQIRKLRPEDAKAAAALEAACFSQPWKEETFREYASHPDFCYMTAWDGEHLVGNCGVRNIVGEGEITNVAVAAEYRGQGLARRLLQALLEQGAQMGITDFTLEVRDGNEPAIRLYESLGFVQEGLRRNFYENPKEDARIYWKRDR